MKLFLLTLSLLFSPLLPNAATAQNAPASERQLTMDEVFHRALAHEQQGDIGPAVALLRRILAVAPDHLAARQRLAQILFRARAFGAAEYHLKELIERDPNRANHARYIEGIQNIVRAEPSAVFGNFALTPSTNITGGSLHEKLSGTQFTIDNQQEAGIGATMTLGGSVRFPMGSQGELRLRNAVTYNWYCDEKLRSTFLANSANYTHYTPYGKVEAGLNLDRKLAPLLPASSRKAGQPCDGTIECTTSSATYYGMSLAFDAPINDKLRYRLSGRRNVQRHDDFSYQDGVTHTLSGNFYYRATPATRLNAGLSLSRYKPSSGDDLHLAYRRIDLSGGSNMILDNGFVLGLNLSAGYKIRDEKGYSKDFRGEEIPVSASLSVQNNNIQIFGTVPRARCTFRRNFSNVEFFDTRSLGCDLSLSHEF